MLEGAHALKHAIRFGAALELVITPDRAGLDRFMADLAPDVSVPDGAVEVDGTTWRELAGIRDLPSPSLAVARRPQITPGEVLAAPGHVVVLVAPTHLGNVGAAIRTAAGADAGGLLVVGAADPWHPQAVRGAAGLQFALPVSRTDELPPTSRPVVALDPAGGPVDHIPADAALLFGSERSGLPQDLLDRADHRLAIPMRPGVSSLNLAVAVGIVLYTTG